MLASGVIRMHSHISLHILTPQGSLAAPLSGNALRSYPTAAFLEL